MSNVEVAVTRLGHGANLDLPAYESGAAAGMDLMAAIEESRDIAPGASALIPTGLAIALPAGFEAQVRPRSGLALRHGLSVLNTPGTIDADYRGEVGVILINHGTAPFQVEIGMRIAQLVVQRRTTVEVVEVEQLSETDRGSGGFGSTGA